MVFIIVIQNKQKNKTTRYDMSKIINFEKPHIAVSQISFVKSWEKKTKISQKLVYF